MLTFAGLGAAGCPTTPQGDCLWNGMLVNCNLIRECDSITGAQHWEYAMPGGSTGNVNINIANAAGQIIGHANEQGNFISGSGLPSGTQMSSGLDAAIASALEREKQILAASGITPTSPMYQIQLAAARARVMSQYITQQIARSGSQGTTNLANTWANVNNQQGTSTNTNGGSNGSNGTTGNSGSNQPTNTNFSDILDKGKTWLEGETLGIENMYLALGIGAFLLLGGGFGAGRYRR